MSAVCAERLAIARKVSAARHAFQRTRGFMALCCDEPFEPSAIRELCFPGYERQPVLVGSAFGNAFHGGNATFSFVRARITLIISHLAGFDAQNGGQALLPLMPLRKPITVQPGYYFVVPATCLLG